MATGMQVAEVLIEYAKMTTGTGFTAHLDLDHSPHIVNTAEPDVLVIPNGAKRFKRIRS